MDCPPIINGPNHLGLWRLFVLSILVSEMVRIQQSFLPNVGSMVEALLPQSSQIFRIAHEMGKTIPEMWRGSAKRCELDYLRFYGISIVLRLPVAASRCQLARMLLHCLSLCCRCLSLPFLVFSLAVFLCAFTAFRWLSLTAAPMARVEGRAGCEVRRYASGQWGESDLALRHGQVRHR